MEIVFESTRDFEKELAVFNHGERKIIIDQINQSAQLFLTDKSARFVRKITSFARLQPHQ